MSTNFKILQEQTFTVKLEELYLMLIRVDDGFCIEITSRNECLGRKNVVCQQKAKLLYKSLAKRLSDFKSVGVARQFLHRWFTFNVIDKMIFVVIGHGTLLTNKDFVRLKDKIDFRTRVKIDCLYNTHKENALTIYVYAGSEKKPFCVLTGTREAKALRFQLI